jgi:dTMP kinase
MKQPPTSRGMFVTLEGGEGVGKTSNVNFVVDFLRTRGIDSVVSREPGGTPLAEEVRELLLNVRSESMDPMAELLLVFAARAQHLANLIVPALAAGRWVVCDRFTDTSYAYQGGGRGMAASTIGMLENMVQGDLRPDLTVYLDVPVAVAAARIAERDHDRFEREREAFFDAVRNTYLARVDANPHMHLVDASVPLPAVQSAIVSVLEEFLEDCG